MRFKYKKEDMLDLCEESIKDLFTYCVATKETSPDNMLCVYFVEKSSEYNVPDLYFDKKRLFEKANMITYLICQLKSVWDSMPVMTLSDGFYKYDGTCWTENKMLLFSLYYLGSGIDRFPLFEHSSMGLIALLEDFPKLKPTLSPKDPNFKE